MKPFEWFCNFCEFSEDNLNVKGTTQIQGSTSPLSILSQIKKKTG